MRTHKIQVTIPADHELAVCLPADFPTGPAEVTIQVEALPLDQRIIRLGGVLAPRVPPPPRIDPIADALQEFHHERQQRIEKFEIEKGASKDS
jgi:hypothetical protein